MLQLNEFGGRFGRVFICSRTHTSMNFSVHNSLFVKLNLTSWDFVSCETSVCTIWNGIFWACNKESSFSYMFLFCAIDMLAATSVLQQEATEIRSQRVNWQSYHQ